MSRMRTWMGETHGAQFELLRHFIGQQFTSELFGADQVRRVVVTSLAVLSMLEPVIVRLYVEKYAYLHGQLNPGLYLAVVRADRLFFVVLSMIAAGIVSCLQWQRIFPDRQDFLILRALPLRLYHIFIARFVTSFLAVVTVAVVLNLFAAVLFPLLTNGRWQSPGFSCRYVLVHGGITVGAGLFVFSCAVAVQGVLLNLLPPHTFQRLSGFLQASMACVLIATIPHAFEVPNWTTWPQSRVAQWLPPAWFAGAYETLLGNTNRLFVHLFHVALLACVTVVVADLLLFAGSYRRQVRWMLESATSGKGDGHSAAILTMSNPREDAVLVFVSRTLHRSQQHRLITLFSIGIAIVLGMEGVAPVLLSLAHRDHLLQTWQLEAMAALPLVVGSVLITALCYAFQLPAEGRANWIFRLAESEGRISLLAGAECALVLFTVLPGVLVAFPLEVATFGGLKATLLSALSAAWLLLLVEFHLRDWHKVPFTCPYTAGRNNVWRTIAVLALLFGIAIPLTAHFELLWLHSAVASSLLLLSALAYWQLWSRRRAQWRRVPLDFDDVEDPIIASVKLLNE